MLTVMNNHETRKQTAEMKLLHRVARYVCTDHQRNTEIRKRLNGFSLNIKT